MRCYDIVILINCCSGKTKGHSATRKTSRRVSDSNLKWRDVTYDIYRIVVRVGLTRESGLAEVAAVKLIELEVRARREPPARTESPRT